MSDRNDSTLWHKAAGYPFPADYCKAKDGYYRIYALELEDGFYYVGMTKLPAEKRFEQHVKGVMSSQWTRAHKPVRILEVRELGWTNHQEASAYETTVALEYIDRFGVGVVRGGIVTGDGIERVSRLIVAARRLYGNAVH